MTDYIDLYSSELNALLAIGKLHLTKNGNRSYTCTVKVEDASPFEAKGVSIGECINEAIRAARELGYEVTVEDKQAESNKNQTLELRKVLVWD